MCCALNCARTRGAHPDGNTMHNKAHSKRTNAQTHETHTPHTLIVWGCTCGVRSGVLSFDEGGNMRLVIPGRPVPASRPRVVRGRERADGSWSKPHAFYPRRYADWLEAASWQVRASGKRVEGPVRVSVVVRRDSIEVEVTPSSVQRPSGVRGDLDNIAGKAVLDALVAGGVLADDRQVTVLEATFA